MNVISTATLALERATPGAVLYKNKVEGEDEAITTVYLRKSGLSEPFPSTIEIAITVPDGD